MPEGVFQTDRAIFDNPIWKNPAKFRLFFYIYGNAVFAKDGVDIGSVHVSRGQLLKSYRNLADELEYLENRSLKKYSISHLKKLAEQLSKEKRIEMEVTELGTLFTILNYEQYQRFERFQKSNKERRENGVRTEREQNENNNNNDKNVKNDKNDKNGNIYRGAKFNPPTVEEVKLYCLERNNGIDAQYWHNWYSSKGWMVGKNKMEDWRAAVRTWERNNKNIDKSPKMPRAFQSLQDYANEE